MKPFAERNPVVVGAVGLAVLAGAVFAAFNVEDLPLIGGGTTYRAAFRDASGLEVGNEVRIAGVKVGKVTDIGLAHVSRDPYVRVTFRINPGQVALGRDTEATIRIKTVLGQKYLALDPSGPGELKPGQEIPLEHTASPFDVMQAVNGLADTLDQIDTQQLGQAFTVLSQAFADTPASVRSSLTGLSKLSSAVADRDAELRELLARAHRVTDVVAQRDDEFRKLITDANLLLDEVAKRRDAIHKLLLATNDLATELSGLVADNRAQLEPALRQLRGVVELLQRDRTKLEDTLKAMVPFVDAFANVTGNGRWFDSYVSGLTQPWTPGGR
ncbi:MAG TPA: MCE family protein [Micromonosporaceae bacterium]